MIFNHIVFIDNIFYHRRDKKYAPSKNEGAYFNIAFILLLINLHRFVFDIRMETYETSL